MRQIKVKFDEGLSAYRGRKYYLCEETGRYFTQIDGEWLTCTDNYWLEPDCHVADDVEIVVVPTMTDKQKAAQVLRYMEEEWDGKAIINALNPLLKDGDLAELYDKFVSDGAFPEDWYCNL
jgi:hypothetical protein